MFQVWSDDAPTCTDINECLSGPCHAKASCTNSIGSFRCVCDIGYTGTFS